MSSSLLTSQIGQRIFLPGHFDVAVVLEDARPLGSDDSAGYECRVRLADEATGEVFVKRIEVKGRLRGQPVRLIDTLHRILWLVENEPRNLNSFLDEARPDRERLRLVAQTLAGTALTGKKEDGPEHAVATTPAEQAALKKLVANWRTLIDQRLAADPLFHKTKG